MPSNGAAVVCLGAGSASTFIEPPAGRPEPEIEAAKSSLDLIDTRIVIKSK